MIGLRHEHKRTFVLCMASLLILCRCIYKVLFFYWYITALSFVNICARCFFCFKAVFYLATSFFKQYNNDYCGAYWKCSYLFDNVLKLANKITRIIGNSISYFIYRRKICITYCYVSHETFVKI